MEMTYGGDQDLNRTKAEPPATPPGYQTSERAGTLAPATGAGKTTHALGWFSVGLGVTQIVAPRVLCRITGVSDSRLAQLVMRGLGVRELITGLAILNGQRPGRWIRGRVLGDVLDLALLGNAFRSRGTDGTRAGLSALAVAGVTALDLLAVRATRRLEEGAPGVGRNIRVSEGVTVNRPPEEIYKFWRNLENLPTVMTHLESVELRPNNRSLWRVSGPGDRTFEWEAEIVEDRPSALIAWRSLPDADVQSAGSVRFSRAPGNRGTEVRVELRYDPPAGAIGRAIAAVFGKEPSQQVSGDLRRFKQAIETGEVLHSDASIHSGPHPARPARRGKGKGAVR
jgi:uncharacterized membrane protein